MSSATSYANSEINLSQANVTNGNITIATSTMTKTGEYEGVEGAVAINSADELKAFLNGTNNATYGYLTASFDFDWGTVGANVDFASGRTLDGNGNSINLINSASVSEAVMANGAKNFGLFVSANNGTIKNIVFNYNTNISASNASLGISYVGVIAGYNNGTIANCDFNYNGGTFYFKHGRLGSSNRNDYQIYAGSIAGANAGIITNINLQLNAGTMNFLADADGPNNDIVLDARVSFGGIAGRSMSSNAQITNIVAISQSSMNLSITANRSNEEGFLGIGGAKGDSYRETAAIVCANSAYTTGTPSKVDNIILYWKWNFDINNLTVGDEKSSNAVVYGGPNTNVTVIDTNHIVDHCGCGPSNSGSQHAESLANRFNITDSNVNVTLSMQDGKQIITATPKEGYVLGTSTFMTYKNGVEASTAGSPKTGKISLFSSADTRNSYTLEVPAYQPGPSDYSQVGNAQEGLNPETGNDYYWTYSVDTYRIANMSVNSAQGAYTGQNYADNLFSYEIDGAKTQIAGSELKLLQDGKTLSELVMPGKYTITLGAMLGDVAYYNEASKIVVLTDDSSYNFEIALGEVAPLQGLEGWLNASSLTFALQNGVEGGANGYVYEVNGSLPKQVNSLTMSSKFDTTVDGRDYKIYLTKNGERVTNDYTFNIKVDNTAPELSDIVFEYSNDNYNTQNVIYLKAQDASSGLASVNINGVAMNFDSETNNYWAVLSGGETTITATDNAGNVNEYKFDAKIDTVTPTITLDAYYYTMVEGINTKTAYMDGAPVFSTVYVDATATYGVAGGTIYYSIDGGEKQVYTGTIALTKDSVVEFYAESNTYDNDKKLTSETKTVNAVVSLNEVVITNEDIVLDGISKVFDGTDKFTGSVNFAEGVSFDTTSLLISVKYGDYNAGENIPFIIEITNSNDAVNVINNIQGLTGTITKKQINVVINNAERYYRQSDPVFTYASDQIVGFEEKINLVTDATIDSLPNSYSINVADGQLFKNYEIASVTSGTLTVKNKLVDRLIYDMSTINGLDTNNVVGKDVVVKFREADGNEVKLNVAYQYSATIDGEYVDCEAMTIAGYYKVILSLPEEYAGTYELKEGISTFIVKVVDASIYGPQEPETPEEGNEETPTTEAGTYENNTDTNSTVAMIREHFEENANNYVIILAIFVAVGICVAIFVGRKFVSKKN